MVDKILRISKPFILGKCACGCDADIHIRRADGLLCRFKLGHHNKGKNNLNFIGGRFAGKYTYIWIPDHPHSTKDGYVMEHRLVMEKHLGRYLDPIEQVHHKNRNKKDNRIENLQLFPNVIEHNKKHVEEKRINDINKRKCAICGGGTVIRKDTGFPQWFRRPSNKSEWICRNDYRKIRRKLVGWKKS